LSASPIKIGMLTPLCMCKPFFLLFESLLTADNLEFRPHFGKQRIPVPGQKVHSSVRHPPFGIDDFDNFDDEGDEIPELIRRPCANCDQVRGSCSLSLAIMLILIENLKIQVT
jgi:hypothetical protein